MTDDDVIRQRISGRTERAIRQGAALQRGADQRSDRSLDGVSCSKN
jgi:hypothetical protein